MLIIGVDPGANFTGVAVLDGDKFIAHLESDDPVAIWRVIEYESEYEPAIVVLEVILGSGRRDEYIVRTIEIVGYIENRCREDEIPVERVPQQARLANVRNVPKFITGKDEIAAAAHALSYRERTGLGT